MKTQEPWTLEKAQAYIKEQRGTVDSTYRHHFHVMAPVGWINDPNGFVFYQGEYHLFYQYFPYDSKWGPMHWGHCKSKDLLHWEELPVALAPDQSYDKDGCFSGSAIVKDDKLYLLYTGHVIENDVVYQTQCLAVSEDGITFEKVKENPVIGAASLGDYGNIHDFRDPKVFQHGKQYYCVIASKSEDNRGRILLFSSEDLLHWEFVSVLLEGDKEQGIMWECPDLFELDGQDVLILSPIQIKAKGLEYRNISSTMACIGKMDWEKGQLHVDHFQEIDFGLDFYAPQTLEDNRGRRIMIAWMQMWGRTMPTDELRHHWAGAMTIPRELHIQNGRLIQTPVEEIRAAVQIKETYQELPLSTQSVVLDDVIEDNTYLKIVCDLSQANSWQLDLLRNNNQSLRLSYDKQTESFTLSRNNFGYPIKGDEQPILEERSMLVPLVEDRLEVELFRDTSALELFVNEQETMTMTFYEKEKSKELAISVEGQGKIEHLEIGGIQ